MQQLLNNTLSVTVDTTKRYYTNNKSLLLKHLVQRKEQHKIAINHLSLIPQKRAL